MAFNPVKFFKSLIIREQGTITPKEIEVVPGGSSGTKTTITSSQTTNKTVTLPDATDTLVGRATTDTLTNKTLTAPVVNNPAISGGSIENTPIGQVTPAAASVTALSATSANVNGDVVTTNTAIQTLTNKTLTTPAITNPALTGGTINNTVIGNTTPAAGTFTTVTADNVVITGGADFVTTNGTQTVSNKSLVDNSTSIVDNADPTKKITFDAGGTTGTTTNIAASQTANRTITLPDATTTLVGTDTTQTLSNKTISGAVISGGSIDNTPIGASTPSTGSFTTLAATSGTVNGQTIATINGTQVLTNKDIDGGTASNTSRITLPKGSSATLAGLTRKEGTVLYDTDLDKPVYDNGATLIAIGTGEGSGVKNYITNSDAEAGTTGWVTYNDASGTRPVDGTGGTPTLTISNVSQNVPEATPLHGQKSFIIRTPAGGVIAGQGVSYDFTINPGDQAKVMSISFDYMAVSSDIAFSAGSRTTDGTWIVYIYDKDNARLIEPSNFKMFSNSITIPGKYEGEFQTSANSLNYRLIIHATTNTGIAQQEWSFDDVVIAPSEYVYGSPVTDWVPYTPTGSFTTNTTYTGMYRRIGDSIEVHFRMSFAGAPNAVASNVSLPSGMSVDFTKLTGSNTGQAIFGSGVLLDNGTPYNIQVYSSTNANIVSLVYQSATTGNQSNVTQAAPITIGAGDIITGTFQVPVQGLSSSLQTSDRADTRVVLARASRTATLSVANATAVLIPFDTEQIDTHSVLSAGVFTAPVSGFYRVSTMISYAAASFSSGSFINAQLFKNGVINTQLSFFRFVAAATTSPSTSGSTVIELNAGDTIDIRTQHGEAAARDLGGSTTNHVSIERVTGPSAIAASETVSVRANTSTSSVSTTATAVTFAAEEEDTHGAFNPATGVFTAPIAGKYLIAANYSTNATTANAANLGVIFRVLKNGTSIGTIANTRTSASATINFTGGGSTVTYLNAGDTLQLQTQADSGIATTAMTGSALGQFVSIIKIGNYN